MVMLREVEVVKLLVDEFGNQCVGALPVAMGSFSDVLTSSDAHSRTEPRSIFVRRACS